MDHRLFDKFNSTHLFKKAMNENNMPHINLLKSGKEKKNQQPQEAPTLPEQYNPSDSSIRRRTGKLGAPRGAERCRARGQGLLRGKAGWLALGGWKETKIGQDQQPCAQRLLRDPGGTPQLRLPPRPGG